MHLWLFDFNVYTIHCTQTLWHTMMGFKSTKMLKKVLFCSRKLQQLGTHNHCDCMADFPDREWNSCLGHPEGICRLPCPSLVTQVVQRHCNLLLGSVILNLMYFAFRTAVPNHSFHSISRTMLAKFIPPMTCSPGSNPAGSPWGRSLRHICRLKPHSQAKVRKDLSDSIKCWHQHGHVRAVRSGILGRAFTQQFPPREKVCMWNTNGGLA